MENEAKALYRPPIVPSVFSMLESKAVKRSVDGKLLTVRREDLIEYEEQARKYYRILKHSQDRDFVNLNAFLYLFYQSAAPKSTEIEGRYFKLLLGCYIHAHRDYLLTDGIRRLDAKNSMKSDLLALPLVRPYFPTWSNTTFATLWHTATKTRPDLLEHVKDHHPLSTTRRKLVKPCRYYRLTEKAEQIIKNYQNKVLKQYEETITTLRAKAYLLHTFEEPPIDLRTLTKVRRQKEKKRHEKHIKEVLD